MSFNIGHILTSMSPVGLAIFAVLVLMGIASTGVTVERVIAFHRSSQQSKAFADQVLPLLENWKVEEIVALSRNYHHSVLAKLFTSVLSRYAKTLDGHEGAVSAVELARSESGRQLETLGADLRSGMNVLATVGSIAPFVGLLGTVVGIIAAFQGIGATGSGGIAAVSTGIAEALVETAFGLMVAIPAVIMFNYLNSRVAGIELALNRSLGELTDEMEYHYGVRGSRHKKQAA